MSPPTFHPKTRQPPGISSRETCHPRGFTLIELLAAIAIISLLAALLFSGVLGVQERAQKAKAASNLRQVALAITSYANENNSRLPGPIGLGIYPYYEKTSVNFLSAMLAPYLGLPAQTGLAAGQRVLVPVLVCPGFSGNTPDPSVIPNYVQNSSVPGIYHGRPLGDQGSSGSPGSQPLTVFDIGNLGGLSKVWVLTNPDQQMTDDQVRQSGWFSLLPPKPVFGKVRLRLFLDGHLEAAPLQ